MGYIQPDTDKARQERERIENFGAVGVLVGQLITLGGQEVQHFLRKNLEQNYWNFGWLPSATRAMHCASTEASLHTIIMAGRSKWIKIASRLSAWSVELIGQENLGMKHVFIARCQRWTKTRVCIIVCVHRYHVPVSKDLARKWNRVMDGWKHTNPRFLSADWSRFRALSRFDRHLFILILGRFTIKTSCLSSEPTSFPHLVRLLYFLWRPSLVYQAFSVRFAPSLSFPSSNPYLPFKPPVKMTSQSSQPFKGNAEESFLKRSASANMDKSQPAFPTYHRKVSSFLMDSLTEHS